LLSNLPQNRPEMHPYVLLAAAAVGALAAPAGEDKETATETRYVAIGNEALTTTFVPPASCTQSRLTMLSDEGYRIWMHEPMPNGSAIFSDCYPSQFIQGYTKLPGSAGTIAPLMSPLVCPRGWTTAQKQEDTGYIACCAEGYRLHPPESIVVETRPALGGTCYSTFTAGQTITATIYESGRVVTREHSPNTADQAFAHVIEGFALDLKASQSSSSSMSDPTSSSIETIATETNAPEADEGSSSPSGGAIAGAVIGSLVGVIAIVAGAFLLVRRRATRHARHEQLGPSRDQPSPGAGPGAALGDKPLPNVYPMHDRAADMKAADLASEVTSMASPTSELGGLQRQELGGMARHELASVDYVELEDNQRRHEMHN
jgi:hypothetical protein